MTRYTTDAGIYKITCSHNGKVYIGKAVNIYKRLNRHENCAKHSDRDRYHFHNAIIKHGWDSFTVEILEVVKNFDKSKDNDDLLIKEAYYISLFDSTDRNKGYNICGYSTDSTGITQSDEHVEKRRMANTGKTRTDETKEKMRKAQTGKKLSNETKEKIRQANLGKKASIEAKENMRQAGLQKVFTDEHKEKISQAKLGKPRSEEMKEKLRGRKASEETKEKMSQSRLGGKHSEEHKEKIRQSMLKRHADKKNVTYSK